LSIARLANGQRARDRLRGTVERRSRSLVLLAGRRNDCFDLVANYLRELLPAK
jgi:hypothetical protein